MEYNKNPIPKPAISGELKDATPPKKCDVLGPVMSQGSKAKDKMDNNQGYPSMAWKK